MPALVCVVPPGFDMDSVSSHRHLGSRNVEIDREQPSGPDEQVVGEDRVDGSDSRLPTPHQAHSLLDRLHVHVT